MAAAKKKEPKTCVVCQDDLARREVFACGTCGNMICKTCKKGMIRNDIDRKCSVCRNEFIVEDSEDDEEDLYDAPPAPAPAAQAAQSEDSMLQHALGLTDDELYALRVNQAAEFGNLSPTSTLPLPTSPSPAPSPPPAPAAPAVYNVASDHASEDDDCVIVEGEGAGAAALPGWPPPNWAAAPRYMPPSPPPPAPRQLAPATAFVYRGIMSGGVEEEDDDSEQDEPLPPLPAGPSSAPARGKKRSSPNKRPLQGRCENLDCKYYRESEKFPFGHARWRHKKWKQRIPAKQDPATFTCSACGGPTVIVGNRN